MCTVDLPLDTVGAIAFLLPLSMCNQFLVTSVLNVFGFVNSTLERILILPQGSVYLTQATWLAHIFTLCQFPHFSKSSNRFPHRRVSSFPVVQDT